MKKLSFLFVFLLFAVFTAAVNANVPSDQPVIVKEFLMQVDFMRGRVTQLAEAMPQSTYDWRPAEGVRSVAEVYLHTAFGNYISVTVSGGMVPEDVGFVMDFEKINEWDTQTTDKKEIIDKMNESFDILKSRIANLTEEDINREVEVFGMKFSVRNFIISMISHCHEHLGQSIAYARMNGVTPPWSTKGE
jgi:uncharacterized damage-inducible protein DinB